MKVVTSLLSRQAQAADARERDMKIRRKVVPLEKACLRLTEEKFALGKARFGIEIKECELRLNF